MLNAIIRNSLRFRSAVLAISLLLLVYGSYLTTQLPIDVFPDLDRPRVVLITECPGLATEEVEALVTNPLEIALLGGNGVDAVRSQSTAGLNVIYIEFDWGVELQTARQNVQERLNSISDDLPDGIVPQMTPQSSIMGQVLIAGLYRRNGPNGGQITAIEDTDLVAELVEVQSKTPKVLVWQFDTQLPVQQWKRTNLECEVLGVQTATTPEGQCFKAELRIDGRVRRALFKSQKSLHRELGTLGQWIIRPRLLKVKGVSEIFLQGGGRKQYQVLVNPDALIEFGVTLKDVEDAMKASNLNTSGGFAITGESERPIRIFGRVGPGSEFVVQDLLQVPLKANNKRTVLLQEVATVTEGNEFIRGDAAVDGTPAAVISVVKQPHVDTRSLTD
ncbi:MAG: efflux RND transporter permease subunit, partial [Planctomycetota bacterium]